MGSEIKMEDDYGQPQGEDRLNTGLAVLSFCIPLAGAIIYFINKDDKPVKAKKACNLAIWGMVVGFVINVLSRLVE